MERIKNFDTFFLERDGVRIWACSYHLDLLSPTSPAYCPGLQAKEITLSGMIFRCGLLSSFFYGEADLRSLVGLSPYPKPDLSEVVIEVWHTNDRKLYTFEHSFRLYNVIPSNFKHAECSCCCGGEVDLKFDKFEICEANKRQISIDEKHWFKPEYLKEEFNESKIVLAT